MRIGPRVGGPRSSNFAPAQPAAEVTPGEVLGALRNGDPSKLQGLKDRIQKMDPKDQKALLGQIQKEKKKKKDDLIAFLFWTLLRMRLTELDDDGGDGDEDGGAQGAGGAGGGGGAGGAQGAGGAGDVQGAGGAQGAQDAQLATLPKSLQVSDPRLRRALAGISKDPEGRRLLDTALQKGLVKVVENKNLPPGVEGRYTNNGAGKGIVEVRDARSPDLVATLAHKLGRAANREDNTSQLGERAADAIGARIQARITGRDKGRQLNADSYSHLAWDNNIKQALKLIGADV